MIHTKGKTGPNYLDMLPSNTVWCFEANDDTASLRAHKATTREHGTYLEELNVSVEVDQLRPELYDKFKMLDNDRAALKEWFEFQNKNILEIWKTNGFHATALL